MAGDNEPGLMVSRRSAFGAVAAGTVGALASTSAEAASSSTGAHAGAGQLTTPPQTVVQTRHGAVRGYVRNGIYTFKGIPYGADTGGANRWLPAGPPQAWQGVLPTLTYGPVCPHPVRTGWGNSESQFIYDWDDGFAREDMLRVNVWSQGLGAGAKKPVMVWIHGGGFSSGSSQELPGYDGENLAKRGVVLVSLNHRLNALGFLDLSEVGGEAYRGSANVGLTDLVLALQWVRENIAAFGGDPSNVTIFGQSGGGSKVTALMAMPAARGLFHKAIAQSGGGGAYPHRAAARQFAAELMRELGLSTNDIAGLQKTPHDRLLDAGQVVSQRLNAGLPPGGMGAAPVARVGFGPSIDGEILTETPFGARAPDISSGIPFMVGSVRDEATSFVAPMDEAGASEALDKAFPGQGAALQAELKRTFPTTSPATRTRMVNGLGMRQNLLRLSDLKTAQGGAPVYNYWFTWAPTVLEGRPGSFHCLDLAFCFDNTARWEQATGDTPEARALAAKMSTAFVNFARTGRPDQPGLAWPPYSSQRRTTMIFDNRCRIEDDPAGVALRIARRN